MAQDVKNGAHFLEMLKRKKAAHDSTRAPAIAPKSPKKGRGGGEGNEYLYLRYESTIA